LRPINIGTLIEEKEKDITYMIILGDLLITARGIRALPKITQ